MNKSDIRKNLLEERKKIKNKDVLSKKITANLIKLDIYNKANIIALYNSLPDEVDTSYLINKYLDKKTILLPRIIDNKIDFIKINKDSKYNKSKLGVLEPIGKVYHGNIDLIIVPGVAFDKKLNRLGFGMGYYDKYLENKDIYKIGLAYGKQIVNLLPYDNFDIKMNMIITENKVYK